jgi:hypothetical protein
MAQEFRNLFKKILTNGVSFSFYSVIRLSGVILL